MKCISQGFFDVFASEALFFESVVNFADFWLIERKISFFAVAISRICVIMFYMTIKNDGGGRMEKKSSGEKNYNKKKVRRPTPSPEGKERTEKVIQEETSGKLKIKNQPSKRKISRNEVDKQAEDILKKDPPKRKRPQVNTESPKEPENPYLKRIKRVLFGAIAVFVLIAVSVGAMIAFLFKINTITVEGSNRYKQEDIIDNCCINIGDNFLFCSTAEGEEKIVRKFPYIEEVSIEKKPFTQINIVLKEAKPESVIESKGKYVVLSKKGKVIEINDSNKYNNIPAVLGAELKDVQLCYPIKYKDANLEKYLNKLTDAISKYKIKDIQTIDMSNTTEIKLIRKNGFVIIVGDFENIEYKLKTAQNILSSHVKENAVGRLDVSLAFAEGGKSYLKLGEESKVVSQTPVKENSKNNSSAVSSKSEEKSSAESSLESSAESSAEESTSETAEPSEESEETFEESDDGTYDDSQDDDTTYDDGQDDDTTYDDSQDDDITYDDGQDDDTTYDDGQDDDTTYDDGQDDDTTYDDGQDDDTTYDDDQDDNTTYDDDQDDNTTYDDGQDDDTTYDDSQDDDTTYDDYEY